MSWEKIVFAAGIVAMLIWLSFSTTLIKDITPSLGNAGKALIDTAIEAKDIPVIAPKK